ncbi:hypothetical protein [Archangium sp. Cb G35]|uniref:hypothetical protein n=1 Tax=Archangium sp. Cb G35 TaxID=1920190 RepID=UPI0009F886C2|nr:hypothetical protein [Archangium sp. Cb G35]
MRPESPNSVQNELGYTDVIRYGQEYAATSGYDVLEITEAVETRPNYWRIRFGLAPRGSGRVLDVEFDEAQRKVIGATEVAGAAGRGPLGP